MSQRAEDKEDAENCDQNKPVRVDCALGCPFCGRQPKITSRAAHEEGINAGGYIAFAVCMCGTYSAKAHQSGGGNTEDEAIASALSHWNTRVA